MKKLIFVISSLLISFNVCAQSFSDDFESYTAGDFLASSNSKWTTWKNQPGSSEDVKVVSTKAHNSNNSIYFSSNLTSGGPTDVVLPLGGEYSTGKMAIELWMFVETNKVGYFNLQTHTKSGTGWAADFTFNETGKVLGINTIDGTLFESNYAQNEWMKVNLNINLNTSEWVFLINDQKLATFSNSNTQIAGINLFSMSNSSFWIDDISYIYTPFTLSNLNAGISGITYLGGKLAGTTMTPEVIIRNLGSTTITSIDVTFTYNGTPVSKQFTGLNVGSLQTYVAAFNGVPTVTGQMNATANITAVNGVTDDDSSDDSKTIVINPITPADGKKVIAEEGTGTWCGWCPRGAVFMDMMSKDYSDYFIGVAVHNNDPMMNVQYDNALKSYVSGYPSMLVDRMPKIDPSAVEADFMKRIVIEPKGVIKTGAEFNSSTGILKVSLTTTFKNGATGNYKIACIITENGVTGTTSKYAQANYYAGGQQGKMGGYESLPNPVPANMMVYDHVARFITPGFQGDKGGFPTSISAGGTYTHTFTFDISQFNSDKIHIVGMLIGPNNLVDNGSSNTIAEGVANGYVSGTELTDILKLAGPEEIQIFPNPTTEFIYLPKLTGNSKLIITDISGKEVINHDLMNDEAMKPFSVSSLESGLYILKILNNQQVYSTRLIKQ